MEKRRRRRRRRKNGLPNSSKSPQPLSIDMLRKKRHKNAKTKRIASVRLDLDDSSGFNTSHSSRKQIIWKYVTILLALAAIGAILYDYGFAKLGSQIADVVSKPENNTPETMTDVSESTEERTVAALNDIKELQESPIQQDVDTKSVFYPEGSPEAVGQIKLAISTASVGLISKAMDLLDEVEEIDPAVTGVDYIRATMYYDNGDLDKAREYYLIAAEQKETYFLSHQQLGKLEYQEKNYVQAITHLAIVRKLKPDDASTASLLSYALRFNQQYQEGLFEALTAQKLEPEIRAYEVQANLAAIQAGTYQPTRPIQDILNAAEINASQSPFDLVTAAGWEHWQGNSAKADLYWKAIRPDSSSISSLKELKQDPLFLVNPPKQEAKTAISSKPLPLPGNTVSEILQANETIPAELQTDILEPQFELNLSLGVETTPDSDFLQLGAEPTIGP